MRRVIWILAAICLAASVSLAQPPAAGQRGPGPGWDRNGPPGGPGRMGGGQPGPGGRWWADPAMVQKLGLSDDQQKRLADTFQQNRMKLIDLSASVQREEAVLEPILAVDRPDEAKAIAQIGRVADARAELEKANGRMLLGLRAVLTPEQWHKLQAERPGMGPGMGRGVGMGMGRGMGGPPAPPAR